MSEKESPPNEYGYTKEDLQIPNAFKMNQQRITELIKDKGSNTLEIKNHPYLGPYHIGEKIRSLKKEYYNQEKPPGAERKMEIIQEYERLKDQRENARGQIVQIIQESNESIDDQIDRAIEHRKKMEHEFDACPSSENKERENIQKKWQEDDDFIKLFEQEDIQRDLTLDQEDDGLNLT